MTPYEREELRRAAARSAPSCMDSQVNPVGYSRRFGAMFLGLAKRFREDGDFGGARMAVASARRNIKRIAKCAS